MISECLTICLSLIVGGFGAGLLFLIGRLGGGGGGEADDSSECTGDKLRPPRLPLLTLPSH